MVLNFLSAGFINCTDGVLLLGLAAVLSAHSPATAVSLDQPLAIDSRLHPRSDLQNAA